MVVNKGDFLVKFRKGFRLAFQGTKALVLLRGLEGLSSKQTQGGCLVTKKERSFF